MKLRIFLIALLAFCSSTVFAQTTIEKYWVRATVPSQKATGAFMQITSPQNARLISARSPVAHIVEIHEMAMEGEIMKMRAVPFVALPAGKMVELKPGDYHIMLIDLKNQLKEGEKVPLTLVIEKESGDKEVIDLEAPVRPLNTKATEAKH